MGDEGARELARAMAGHKALSQIYLEDNIVGDVGAKAFARALRVLKSDFELVLTNNNAGDAGAVAFAINFEKNGEIRSEMEVTINLTRNKVGDDGARALYRALKDKQNEQFAGVNIVLAECSVSAAFKVTNKLERAFGLFEWSEKYDEKKLFKIFGHASRIRGWMLISGQMLTHGMDTLIPDGDEERLEALRQVVSSSRRPAQLLATSPAQSSLPSACEQSARSTRRPLVAGKRIR